MTSMIGALGFLNISSAIGLAAGAAAMFGVWSAADLVDDAQVAARAKAEYVTIAEKFAAQAKAETARQLLMAEQAKARELADIRAAYDGEINKFQAALDAGEATNKELADEIDRLEKSPAVPSVRDFSLKLRH